MLEKFADYYDPERPKLDKVTIRPVDGAEPLAAAIEAGDIQLYRRQPGAVAAGRPVQGELRSGRRHQAGPGFQSVWINPWRDPMKVTDFNKPLEELKKEKGFMVRLAIAKALDRDLFVKQAAFGNGVAGLRHDQPGHGLLLRRDAGRDLRTGLRPRRRARAAGRGRLPGWRGLPGAEAADHAQHQTRRAGRRQHLQEGAGHHGQGRRQGLLGRHRGLQQDGL